MMWHIEVAKIAPFYIGLVKKDRLMQTLVTSVHMNAKKSMTSHSEIVRLKDSLPLNVANYNSTIINNKLEK
jgi:hypothetical protein